MDKSALLALLGPDIKRIARDTMRDLQGDLRVAGDGVVTGRFSAQNFSWDGRELELGWIKDNVIWIYGSATTLLIYGDDASERFPTGTKLRWKQGGSYQYATVSGVSYSDGTTTVTVSGDSVSNTDLTDNYFSYMETPPGWDSWTSYSPTKIYAGGTTDPTSFNFYLRYATVGNICFVNGLAVLTRGSGDRLYTQITLPIDWDGTYFNGSASWGEKFGVAIPVEAGTNLASILHGTMTGGTSYFRLSFTYGI